MGGKNLDTVFTHKFYIFREFYISDKAHSERKITMEQNERRVGTTSRGIRCPIIRQGDDLASIVTESVLEAAKYENFDIRDRDVIAMTESIVARAQGNYASVDNIADDIKAKFGADDTIGVIFPILSRNRFAICLRGIAKAAKKIVLCSAILRMRSEITL